MSLDNKFSQDESIRDANVNIDNTSARPENNLIPHDKNLDAELLKKHGSTQDKEKDQRGK
jgi:hypothetical protein